eukprot:2049098-Rhodomonas_salina.1
MPLISRFWYEQSVWSLSLWLLVFVVYQEGEINPDLRTRCTRKRQIVFDFAVRALAKRCDARAGA